jgi:hypothetical protein
MKELRSEYTYDHPFDLVLRGRDLRYPTHPLLPAILSSVVISQSVSPDNSVSSVTRRRTANLEIPEWVKRAIGVKTIDFLETVSKHKDK